MDIGRARPGSMSGLLVYDTREHVRVIVVCVILNKSSLPPHSSLHQQAKPSLYKISIE
jgi:hypothetical protein